MPNMYKGENPRGHTGRRVRKPCATRLHTNGARRDNKAINRHTRSSSAGERNCLAGGEEKAL